jgi:peptidyl-prolyl cis-trans isomerase A (cyclophilin A)
MIRLATFLLAFALAGPVFGQGLTNPAALNQQAPAVYRVNVDTSRGAFVLEVHRDWAPLGADRFYNLVKNGFFDNARFFRVLPGFVVQFGLNADPKLSAVWRKAEIGDDPVKQSNARGTITFATAGPNTRTTQVFINYKDNAGLDSRGFAPFGRVVSGMNIVDAVFSGYGESPDQSQIESQGNAYLMRAFPKLDYIKKATIIN